MSPGKTTPTYRDPHRPVDERVEDLLSRMTLEEKAGQLFHSMLSMNADGTFATDGPFVHAPTPELIEGRGLTHFNLIGQYGVRETAQWVNRVQELAASTRLGIPITLSTDPRHAFTDNPGASFHSGAFSAWPEPLGLAAIGDPALVERFGDTVRREYLAVGFRVALHPQIDLATEPRWSRQSGTFGSSAELTSELVRAYVRGLQGTRLGPDSVAAMVKHFPGDGPQKDGEDPHFAHGKEQIYPGGMREYHLQPFKAAVEAGCSQVMPYYGQPIGTDWEEVGFGFNRDVLTGLLRERLGFDGIVCTDWGLLTDAPVLGELFPARAWGAEHLTVAERAAKALDAGSDQFGGEQCPEVSVELVRSGRVTEERIDESVRRLLREKFTLGLFEHPYVDPDRAEETVGAGEFTALGEAAQRRSLTVLTNHGLLPLVGPSEPVRAGDLRASGRRVRQRRPRSRRRGPRGPAAAHAPRGAPRSLRVLLPLGVAGLPGGRAQGDPAAGGRGAHAGVRQPRTARRPPRDRREGGRWSPTTARATRRSWTSPSDGRGPRGDCRSNCRAPWRRSRRHGRTSPTTPKTPCSRTGTD
ncbi:glycoside hydrolase family 3 protein [Streptomyces mirabilis]|uniref:glycoside hydrolase family 3 protein n=1 Tax=Streptomyces mirabilis TaxID=68239 RepID=UPI0036497548